MKAFDIDNYRRHLNDLKITETTDPFLVTTYLRGAFDIANSFNTEEQASGILSKMDLLQECYYIMCKAWGNQLTGMLYTLVDNPKAYIFGHYLKANDKNTS